ncbi:hypothetical protein [Streptomyces halobius]|uniref:Uncharacterized protein n=1 Tax=Streptomyces halobius TaxID=2879846 RepID=A0ABY4M3E1_9ACTN|nr:hypothetical protein [Streptomyces halobius]UQA90761.1 hypothetical protein K9S39_01645 [Streptomyces halobius]
MLCILLASLSGSGFVDRVVIDDTKTVHAYVGELVPPTQENDNRIAVEMLRLLGDGGGKLFGPVSFFQVRPRNSRPSSLDTDHQELLKAAHQAATAKLNARR